VKVQHRWIREQIPGDIKLTVMGARFAKWLFKDDFRFMWLAEEFESRLPLELDFRLEAENCVKSKRLFKETPYVQVPTVYNATPRVLVMSFEKGYPINQVRKLNAEGYDLREVANLVSQTFAQMIFKDGFVHADPHPGNLLVTKDDKGKTKIVLLDHGVYTTLSEETRHAYTELWRSLISQDNDQLKQSSERLGCPYFELFASVIA
jgi:aarF domain-containing kinase